MRFRVFNALYLIWTSTPNFLCARLSRPAEEMGASRVNLTPPTAGQSTC